MDDNTAFALGLITSSLQTVFVMLSWILTTYLGRRTIYVWGSAINTFLLVCLGIAASVGDPKSDPNSLAQASLGLIVSVLFTLGPAPASWVIIGETSAIRLRPLTTGVGRGCYYMVNIPCIFLSSYMLNPLVGFFSIQSLAVTITNTGVDWKPWRQVRLRLGWDRLHLPGHGILLPSGDEGTVLSRDRYHVHAQSAGSPVEEHGHRYPGRRVDGDAARRVAPWLFATI
ncbi:MFS transporter [Candidatus Bathyarchaeota archaeon]|nr:MFS transporter [Candidatus Bathyarchaeota archaeon]